MKLLKAVLHFPKAPIESPDGPKNSLGQRICICRICLISTEKTTALCL